MIQIMIADDHELVRTGIKCMLANTSDIEVIAEAGSGEEAIRLVKDKSPDVLLLDVNMPGLGGMEAARRILATNKSVKIIMLSAYCQDPLPYNLLKLGASGYLTKSTNLEELVKAIRTVAAGHKYLDPEIAKQLALRNVLGFKSSPFDLLSVRELDVATKIAKGFCIQDIADKLCISPKTVNTYRYRIFEKLKVKNDVELTLLVIHYGILDCSEQSLLINVDYKKEAF